jgi:hypothetical protein
MIKNYLETLQKFTGGPQGLHGKILELGEKFTELDRTERPLYIKPRKKECYRNSIVMAISSGLDYYQGYCLTEGIPFPMEHAFNVENGKVVDITATKFKIKVTEWFGVKIPVEIINEYLEKKPDAFIDGILSYYLLKLKYESKEV